MLWSGWLAANPGIFKDKSFQLLHVVPPHLDASVHDHLALLVQFLRGVPRKTCMAAAAPQQRKKWWEQKDSSILFFFAQQCLHKPSKKMKLWNYGLKAFSQLITASTTGITVFGLTAQFILFRDEDSHTSAAHSYVEAISSIFSAVTNVDLAGILTDS